MIKINLSNNFLKKLDILSLITQLEFCFTINININILIRANLVPKSHLDFNS